MVPRGSAGLLSPAALFLLLLGTASALLEDVERLHYQAGAATVSGQWQQRLQQPQGLRHAVQRHNALQQPQQAQEQQEEQQQAQQEQQQDVRGHSHGHEKQWRRQEGPRSPRRRLPSKPSGCKCGLWETAKAAPDLRVLVAVQQLTPLNFFSPFGKTSQRAFTVLAPTDAAWGALFAGASYKQQVDLRDGLAALLLYHQVLSRGYSAAQMAAKYSVLTALGPAIDEDSLLVDMDEYDARYVASGRAPQNYASVLWEAQACGSHMIVLDTVLLPFSKFSALPRLATNNPINGSAWDRIMQLIAAPGPPAVPQRALDPPLGIQEDNGGGDGDGDEPAGGPTAGGAPLPAVSTPSPPPPPPAPPGVLPNCSALAASGQLLTYNGTLAGCNGTAAVEGSVVLEGPTQTAVSDAGQVDPRTQQQPAAPSSSGTRQGGAGSLAAAAAAAVACIMLG